MKARKKRILVLPGWRNNALLDGIIDVAQELDWSLNLEPHYTGLVPAVWQGDGAIIGIENPALLKYAQGLQVPVVDISATLEHGFSRVCHDDADIGRKAAAFFLRGNFRHFVSCFPVGGPVSLRRDTAFRAALQAAGRDCHILKGGRDSWESLKKKLTALLRELEPPIAIFVTDDCKASLIIETCLDGKFKVPEDISILGVGDNQLICEHSLIPLSSLGVDWYRQGQSAARILASRLKEPELPSESLSIPALAVVPRQSTDPYAVQHPDAKRLLKYLRQHFRDDVTVKQMAVDLGISRRQVNYLLKAEGLEPAQILEELRLEEALRLFQGSRRTLADIAQSCGLKSHLRLHRACQRRYGVTPAELRRGEAGP